jgi:hypothetical protein
MWRMIAGVPLHVWVDETRPRNQGAALTAWELGQHGVPHTVIPDNTGGHLMQHGMVDMVIVGTDRVTADGDVCNKIGTYLKALAAKENGVPFYVGLPSPTIDFSVSDGLAEIPIEQRSRGRGRDRHRPHRRRPRRDRAHRAGRLSRRKLRLRRDTRAPRHRPHHRARDHCSEPGGLERGFRRTRRRGNIRDQQVVIAGERVRPPIGCGLPSPGDVACVSFGFVLQPRACRCRGSFIP